MKQKDKGLFAGGRCAGQSQRWKMNAFINFYIVLAWKILSFSGVATGAVSTSQGQQKKKKNSVCYDKVVSIALYLEKTLDKCC